MAIDAWTLGRTLGHGSTATVSLATSPSSPLPFAVKSADLARSAPLQHEHRILSSLSSRHVISCLGSAVSAGRYHIFLEYAPGGSLADVLLARGGLDESSTRAFARDVLRGLADLHAAGLAHCDVKAQNVLVGPDGRARLGDLGCSRRLGDGGNRQVRGTPAFLSPEAARGEEQGAAADIWALGCTVVEMATGRPPWPDAPHPFDALRRIAFGSDVPEPPTGASELAKDFLDKCFRRDPRDRWTAEQLLEHPFVLDGAESSTKDGHWVSPKSTLDQAFWDSVDEEDSSVDPSDPAERIQLLASSSGAAAWTSDESWITIRCHAIAGTEFSTNPESDHEAVDRIPADQLHSEELSVSSASNDSLSYGENCVSNLMDYYCSVSHHINIGDRNVTDIKVGGKEISCCCDYDSRNNKQGIQLIISYRPSYFVQISISNCHCFLNTTKPPNKTESFLPTVLEDKCCFLLPTDTKQDAKVLL